MKELSALELAIASSLMAGAMQAAMIQSMVRNKIITDEEGHEIYEQALLMLETNQTMTSSPDVFEAAREAVARARAGEGPSRPTSIPSCQFAKIELGPMSVPSAPRPTATPKS